MKSEAPNRPEAAPRAPRPFLFLEPARLPLSTQVVDARGLQLLDEALSGELPRMVRSVVDRTIARQNRENVLAEPICMSVLNRRRRAARAWLLAVVLGRVDGATRHAVATSWLPILCGTGPDRGGLAQAGRELIEFVRGVATAMLFDQPAENLLPRARALHALEATLAVHLTATLEHATAGRRAPRAVTR